MLAARGEAGIAKTALLGYAAAAAMGMLMLSGARVETEAEFVFAGLPEAPLPELPDATEVT